MLLSILLFFLTPIMPDQPLTITLANDYQPVEVAYIGQSGEYLTISARSRADEPIDVTLELLLDNQRLAFNDDHDLDDSGWGEHDARIKAVPLPADGEYTIRVNSFSGAQVGEILVELTVQKALAPCDLATVRLPAHGRFQCTLRLDEDTRQNISARDKSGTLDPVLTIFNEAGERLAYNDDHGTGDVSLDTLDARISGFALQGGETYVLQVSDFTGAAGLVELIFEIVS